jgi:hypothetical protein
MVRAAAAATLMAVAGAGAAAASVTAPDGAGAQGPGTGAYAVARNTTGPTAIQPSARYTRVVSRRLPAGLYAITAKVVVRTEGNAQSDCVLTASGGLDRSSQGQVQPGTPIAPQATHPLQYAGRLRSATAVAVECRAGKPWHGMSAKLTAIRLDRVASSS